MRRRRRLLGQPNSGGVYMQSTPSDLKTFLAAAKANGVDPATIQALYNAGADPVQLALAATGARLSAASVEQSDLQTINQDVGASNYAGQYGVPVVSASSPNPNPSSIWDWIAIGAVGLAGFFVVKKLL